MRTETYKLRPGFTEHFSFTFSFTRQKLLQCKQACRSPHYNSLLPQAQTLYGNYYLLWRHHGEGMWDVNNLGCFKGDSSQFYLLLDNFLRFTLLPPLSSSSTQTSRQTTNQEANSSSVTLRMLWKPRDLYCVHNTANGQ